MQLVAPTPQFAKVDDDVIVRTLAQSALLSNYAYDKYMTKLQSKDVTEFVLANVPQRFAPLLADIQTLCGASLDIISTHGINLLQARPFSPVTWQTSAPM